MATDTAVITQLTGQAWVRGADGTLTPLREGMRVPVNAEIVTGNSGSNVQLQVDGAEPFTVGQNREFLLSDEVSNAQPDAAAATATPGPQFDALVAALDAGDDPFAEVDPTAAVLGGGDSGGSSFTRLMSVVETTNPLGLEYPRPGAAPVNDVRFPGGASGSDGDAPLVPPVAEIIVNVGTGDNAGRVSERGLSSPADDSESTSGTIWVSATDGISTVTIGGVTYPLNELEGKEIDTGKGKLIVTKVTPNPDSTSAVIEYTYTLTDAQEHDRGAGNDNEITDDIPVSVQGGNGSEASGKITITIVDDAPEAQNDDATQTEENALVTIDVLGNDTEGADGVDLSTGVKLVEGTLSGAGDLVYNGDGSFTYTPAPGEEGEVSFEYEITDGDGDTSTATVTITLQADSEPVVTITNVQGDDGVVWESALPGGSGGGDLTASGKINVATGGDTLAKLEVQDKDGNWVDVTGGGTVAGAYGTLVVDADGNWTYTLDGRAAHDDAAATGGADQKQDDFAVRATDSDGDEDGATLSVKINDDGPAAENVTLGQATEDAPVEIDVTGSFVAGADGVDLATGVKLVSGSLQGGTGTVVYNGDGTFTYTPVAGEEGTVTFEYEVTDADGDTATATVSITLTQDSEPVVTITNVQGDDGVVWESALPGGSGGGDLTASGKINVATGGDTLAKLEVQDKDGNWVDVTGGGTVAGAYGTLVVDADGNWTYTLDGRAAHDDAAATGGADQKQDDFAVRATDSDGDEDGATLSVKINDDGPAAENVTLGQATEDAPVEIDVTGSFVAGADGVDLATGVKLVSGSLQGGTGTVVYNGDGTFTYTPVAGEEGTVTFEYEVTDADGDTATATVSITLTQDSEPVVTITNVQGDDGVVWESALPGGSGGGDLTASGKINVATGGDTLAKLEVQDKDGNWVDVTGGGTVAGAYGTLVVDADGNWTYTLDGRAAHDDAAATGGADQKQDDFAVRATDSDGDEDGATLSVKINDDGPAAENVTLGQATEDAPVEIDVTGSFVAGADGVDLATGVKLVSGSLQGGTGTVVYNGDGTFTYTPVAGEEGTVTFEYEVTDADGDTATATVSITLTQDSEPVVTITNVQGDDGVVWESALPGGSGGGDLTASGKINVATGGDTLAKLEVQDKDGNWVDVTGGGTVAGAYGTLVVDADGNWTYTLDGRAAHDDAAATGGADQKQDDFAVRATDSDGDEDGATLSVKINDDGPAAENVTLGQATEDAPVEIDVTGSFVAGADGVDLATGVQLVSGSLQGGTGTVVYNGDGTFTYTPVAGEEGTVTFDYEVTDADGDTATATVSITLTQDSEPVVTITNVQGDDGVVWESALPGGSGGGDLTASGKINVATGGDTLAKLEVQDKDGNWVDVTGGGTVAGAYGTLVVDADGNWTYTLDGRAAHDDAAATGGADQKQDDFAVRATDSDGDEDGATLSVKINDDGPAAENVTLGQATEDAPVEIDVTGSFVAGADGVDLATGVQLVSGSLQGGTGTVVYNGDGTFTYTPVAGEEGTVTFDYEVTDADGDTATATVSITLAQDSEPVVTITNVQGDDGVVWESALPGGSGGGDLTASGKINVATGGDTLAKLEVQDKDGNWVDVTGGGTVAGAYGTLVVDADGNWTYTLDGRAAHDDAAATGGADQKQDDFAVRATDSDGDEDGATLSVKINDDGPAAENVTLGQATEDAPVEIDVTGSFVAGADGVDLATGVKLVSGSLQGGTGTVVYNGDGTFTYTPVAGEEGTVTFDYEVTDADGDTATATVSITLAQDSEPVVTITNVQGDDGVVWESALPGGSGGGDLTASGKINVATGGDTLAKLEVQDKDGNWVDVTGGGTVAGAYGTLVVDADGNWTYTLDGRAAHDDAAATGASDQKQDDFAVRATDSDGDEDDATLSVKINDDGPAAENVTLGQATEDAPVEIDVKGSFVAGADGVDLSTGVKLVSGSLQGGTGTVVYNGDGTFTYTPVAGEEGTVTFEYEVTDADGDTATATVSITLAQDSEPVVTITNVQGDDGVVWESALPGGSGGGDLTASGKINVATGGDTLAKLEVQDKDGNWVDVTGGGTVAGAYGTLVVDAAGNWTYTLDGRAAHDDAAATGASDQKQDDFAVRATDSDDDVSPEATLSISINDDGPAANDFIGVGEVTEDSAAANSVGGNLRTDGGNTFGADDAAATDALTYTNVQALLGGVAVNLADYGTLSVDRATGAWTFTLDNTKAATQALKAGETVNVSFDYTLKDKDGDTDDGKVSFTINGQNDAPVLEAHNKEILEDHIATGNVLAGASDAEDDDLSVTQFTVNGTPYAAGTTAIIAGIGEFTISSNGDYTFTPAQDWNGAVPQVTYEVSDGTDTSSSTLDVDVLPVNDAPASEDASGNVTEGLVYTFGTADFAFADAVEDDAMQSVIIDSLPSTGTLLLNGVAVVQGTSISVADLEAGKLTFQAPGNPGENAEFTFDFRVQDSGGTVNGGVDTSASHTFTLTVDQFVSGGNTGTTIKGGQGDDVLLGDQGGMTQNVVAGASYNIALVLDLSGSMNDRWGTNTAWPFGDNRPTRLETAKASLKALLENQLLEHDGEINVTLITFAGTSSSNRISIEGLNASNIDSILDTITSLSASGNTPYGSAFNSAKSWFDQMAGNSAYDDYQNLTFFLTDGVPNDNATNRDNAFNVLSGISAVHGIGIGSGITQSTLDKYDNTDLQGVITSSYETHANFSGNPGSGVNDVGNWVHTGSGSVEKSSNAMRITAGNGSATESAKVTMADAHKMTVTDTKGAFFQFSASTSRWDSSADVFTWRLLKWDASLNDNAGGWVEAESGNNTGTVTTLHHGPGQYLLEFEVNDQSGSNNGARVTIDNIRVYGATLVGQSQIVTDPSDLAAALINGSQSDVVAPVGDDTVHGGDGNDIIFGDAINTANLPWGVDGNPAMPADYNKIGLDALKDFLALKLGHAATDADLYDYITQNHETFNVDGDTHGGTDTLDGGKGDDILYGQGGNDTLIGGEGDDILYGGEGDDIFKWEEGDAGVDAVAVDTIMDFGVGNDSLDLAELLVGENSGNLDQFLSLEQIGADTVIKVSTDGTLGQGHNQEIILKGVDLSDLTGGATSQADMIQHLIQQGKLNVDQ